MPPPESQLLLGMWRDLLSGYRSSICEEKIVGQKIHTFPRVCCFLCALPLIEEEECEGAMNFISMAFPSASQSTQITAGASTPRQQR